MGKLLLTPKLPTFCQSSPTCALTQASEKQPFRNSWKSLSPDVFKHNILQLVKIFIFECFQEQYLSVAVRDEFQRSGRRRRLFHIPKSLMRLSKTRWPFWIKFAGIRAQRVPNTRLLPSVNFVTWPDPIQFWKSSSSRKPKIRYYPIYGYIRHFG